MGQHSLARRTGTLDDTSEAATNVFMEHMLDAETSDIAVEFNSEGTATGGIFDVFPNEDDDVVRGMRVNGDTFSQTVPATPES